MSDDIIPLLKVHEYFRGMRDDALQEIEINIRDKTFSLRGDHDVTPRRSR